MMQAMNEDEHTRVGLFVGTFDPFTIGHDEIVRRALPLFDRLVIGVGENPEKHHMFSLQERLEAIRSLYAHDKRVQVVSYCDLAVDLAKRVGAHYVVKGVRSVQDFEYERVQADYNRKLGGLETLLLYASPAMASISSTAYRELVFFHKDASWMLPGREDD